MKMTSGAAVTAVVTSAVFGLATHSWAATITAASCSLSAVQAAVNTAVNGDKVLIPNGSCAWAGGITTTKQIRIEAQNYTPTPRGTMTRNVTITNNSTSVPLLSFTSGNSFHVGVAGIRFNEGSGNQNHLRLSGSGSKVPLVNDCAFEVKNRFGNQPNISIIAWLSLGGVMWNSYVNGVGGGTGGQCCPEGPSILVNSPRSWLTASTMGTLDTQGTQNVYFENNTFVNFGQAPDVDDEGRLVMRHSLLDGISGLTHGFTSAWGGRHVEYYNNTITTSTNNRNVAGRYFWLRAGTGIWTDNTVSYQNRGYGTPELLDTSDNTTPTSYPQPRQCGWGHDGTNHVRDPIYLWNNTGGSTWGVSQSAWINNCRANVEVFVNAGAKPGYAKYTYPHPLTAAIQPPPPAPSLSISDVTAAEGATASFTLSLSAASTQTVTVLASTADGTATAGSDYTARSNVMLTFLPGTTTQTFTVTTLGDAVTEVNETFTVNLGSATNATIADAQGLGTITNVVPPGACP